MHCGAEVTESSTNKQHHLSLIEAEPRRRTVARLLTSVVMHCRPSRPHPTPGRRTPGTSPPPRPPTPEDARRWSTAPAPSEAEPRTRTTAWPPTSAAMRSRPSRPPPPPGRRSAALPLHSILRRQNDKRACISMVSGDRGL